MIFNGIDLSSHFRIKNIVGRNYVDYQWNLIDVPGMDGVHLGGGRRPPRYIDVYTAIYGKDRAEIRKKIDVLNGIFAVESPVPIIFPDEPDRTYFGVIEMTDDQGDRFFRSDGSFTILCPDPYKYGPELEATFPSDAVSVTNNGTAPANPVFELEVNESTTFAMVSNGEEYLMMGRPYDENQEPVNRFDTVFADNASTLVGWTALPSGTSIPGGIVGGNMGVYSGYAFYAQTFGENPNGWVGPAVKKSLSRAVQDFRMTMDIETLNRQGNVGKIQIDLLDAQDNVVASVQMVDATNGAWSNRAIITAGPYGTGHQIINHLPEGGGWNNFRGVLRIERIGNTFYAYVARVTGGRHHGRLTAQPFVDTLGEYSAPVTQVRVYIAKSKNYNPFPIYFHGGNVWEINDLSNNEVPYIAQPGDKIELDFATRALRINGELRKDLISMGSRFFNLQPGTNNIGVMPENTFNTTIRYREPFK